MGGEVEGYGVIRRARRGFKLGPLFAPTAGIADALYQVLCRDVPADEPVCLDVPEVNAAGMSLAQRYGMLEVFGTARMYTGESPRIALNNVFGVTSFELG
jgi:hypothetical protein